MINRVGKNAAAIAATVVCIALVLCTILPLSGAQAADTTPPVTIANVSGTAGSNDWFVSNATVNLTATDIGTGVNRTLYSLDGAPYVNYISNLTITDGNHTLLYRSIDNASNSESIKFLNVKVDTLAPVGNATIKGNLSSVSGWYNSSVSVNLTATDAVSKIWYISYSLDSGPWTLYNGTFTVGDGQHTLAYQSFDWAGNHDYHELTLSVSDPTITVYKSGDNIFNEWYKSDVTVSLIASGGAGGINHIEYSFNKKNWTTGDTFIVTEEGWRRLYFRAVDNMGIVSKITVDSVGIDKTTPTVGLEISGDKSSKGWYNGDITVKVNVNDPGYATGYWSWDNNSWNTYKDPFTIKWQSSKTIYYRAIDIAGRSVYGNQFIYFRPGSYDQGSMSDSVYINGQTYPANPSATATPTNEPTPRPTIIPNPTPELVPSATAVPDISSGSGNPLAIAVLVGVLAFLGIAAAAVYLFMTKHK